MRCWCPISTYGRIWNDLYLNPTPSVVHHATRAVNPWIWDSISLLALPGYSHATCIDAATTPRGQILTIAFVFPIWFMVGLSIRRLANQHWHRPVTLGVAQAFAWLGLVRLPIGVFALLYAVLGLLVFSFSFAVS
jgi:hypothetical protein